ncbi:MAG: glycosyltransferase family 87 protein [Ktedonobacterales bacterium]
MPRAVASYLPAGWRDTYLAMMLGAIALVIWLHAAGPGAGAGYDFFSAYYRAAREVANGVSPYQQLAKLAIDPESGGLPGTGYVYPPLLAVLLSGPLRLGFTSRACWLLWSFVNVVALLWMGFELNLNLRNSRTWTGAMAFALAALLPAVVAYDLALGQADLLMASLAVGACALWLRGRPWAGGLALGIAIAIKPTLALLLLVWIWKGDWGAALRGALAAVGLIFLPFILVGLGSMREYLVFLVHWNAFSANADFINQSPYALLLRMFTANPATRPLVVEPDLVWPLRLAVIAGVVLLWLRASPRTRESRTLEMCTCLLALLLILLLSPLAEDIHFTLLSPALIGLGWTAWAYHLQNRAAAWALWIAFLISCVPRMQELIYPTHLFIIPGQNDPPLGTIITLVRTSALLWLAVIALVAGQSIIRAVRNWSGVGSSLHLAPLASKAEPGQESSDWHADTNHGTTHCCVTNRSAQQSSGDQG